MNLTQAQNRRQLLAVQPSPSGIFKHFTETVLGSVCESCGLRPNPSEAVIKIPGVRGVFCSNLCCEQGLIYDQHRCWACAARLDENRSGHYCDDACRKFITGEPWGSGKRFLRWLALERPELYRQIFESAKSAELISGCLECGAPLEGRRTDSRFCSDTHKKRFSRKSKTSQKCGISRDTPIGKQGLTEAQNGGSMNTFTPPTQAPEMRSTQDCV